MKMNKEDVCFVCLTVKTLVSDILNTKFQSIYEQLTDLKIDANSFNVCGICCMRLEQSSQLLIMAKQIGSRDGLKIISKFTTLERTDVIQYSVPTNIRIKKELKVEEELIDMDEIADNIEDITTNNNSTKDISTKSNLNTEDKCKSSKNICKDLQRKLPTECSSLSMATTSVACPTALPSTSGFIECATTSLVRPRPPPRQVLREHEILAVINFGSDGSDESDEEEEMVANVCIPRAFQSTLDTPLDPEENVPEESPEPGNSGSNASEGPHNCYEFVWTSFPNPPIPPKSRRERFSVASGPTVPFVDPYDIFTAIWDRQFMEHVVLETNRYAQQVAQNAFDDNNLHPNSQLSRWHDTTVDELYLYFAILIAMGVVVKARIKDYWSTAHGILITPGFRAHMSFDRFTILNKLIHFNNNDDMCARDLSASEAILFKIEPVLLHLNYKFQNMYKLARNIALDESLLQWSGWLDINQCVPNKTASMGIKSYEVCECQTGYLWRFEIHAHKSSPQRQLEDPLNASTPLIVLGLIQGLENKGHTLWMDNFYNSPSLARRLKSWGIDCVGTLRTNRQFVPQALHNLDMSKGQITGLTSGDVDIIVWKDANRVSMLSTYHGIAVKQIRESAKPILILDYNIMMGGMDKKDQMLASYPMERKGTKVWYKKIFSRLLNVSVLNSYIIHRHNSSSSLTHLDFRTNLIKTILLKHRLPAPIPVLLPAATAQDVPVDVTHVCHRVDMYPLHSNGYRKRLVCKVCKKRISTYCVSCNVSVCPNICFQTLHS